MADLYSVLPGLQPSAQELLEAELLVKQILEAKYPDMDLREGMGLRDLVLRPSATLFALCKKATDYYFSQRSISGVDDVTPTDMVDSIMSNWFLSRNIGIKAVINARLYFARKKNISISSDVYFSTDNTIKYYPLDSATYSADSMTYDSYHDEYYVDIDLIAEKEGTSYNLGSGSLLYFSNFDPYFLRAEINYLKSESINSETNLEFINRAKSAISTRNLINVPSVDANLRSQFNYIKRLLTTGMGDVEMIRDQLKAVFEDENPRPADSMSSIGTSVTVTLSNHGYNSGQRINVSNVIPLGYNGDYVINVVDNSTFTYTMAASQGPVTTVPQIKAVNLPILLHNGGMVDVYCSDKLAMSVVQLTTDEFGRANLTGPVYKFFRSDISGGDSEDTIPTLNTSQVSTINVSGTTVTVSTVDPHNFILSDQVTISGALQWRNVTSMTISGLTATVTLNNHGFQIGNTVSIMGCIQPEYNGDFTITNVTTNTFSFIVPINVVGTATGVIKAQVNLINGVHSLTAVSGTSFSFSIPQTTNAPITGTMTATSPMRYSVKNAYTETKSLTSISSAGTEVTVTLNRHGYSQGRYVTIAGCPTSTYNGTWLIKNVLNLDQFTFELGSAFTGSDTQGNISFVTPWYDYGFSQKQSLIIDFGIGNANKTASFEIYYFQNLDSIQEYLDASLTRVLCADYLARGFNFYLVDVEVTAYNGPAPTLSTVTEVADSYLKALSAGEIFVMTDLVTKLRLNGITNIQNPPKVTFSKYTRDLSPVETGIITDFLDPNDRTSVFLLGTVNTHASNIDQTTLAVIK